MAQEVDVSRVLLPSPTAEDPARRTYKIRYVAGELPPAYVWLPEKDWTQEKEAEAIKEDIQRRLKHRRETIVV